MPRMRRCRAPSRPPRRRLRSRSMRSLSACAQAAGSSTSAPGRRGESLRSTRRSAKRPSPRRRKPSSHSWLAERRRRRSPRQPPRTTATQAQPTSQALDIGAADAVVGDQRQRFDAVRARSARRCQAGGRPHRVRRVRPAVGARRSIVEHEIAVVVGPEFLAGSTRLKAGTAQKLVLNTISTSR